MFAATYAINQNHTGFDIKEIPKHVLDNFRIVNVIHPDVKEIIEANLFSMGLPKYKENAAELMNFFNLLSIMISQEICSLKEKESAFSLFCNLSMFPQGKMH